VLQIHILYWKNYSRDLYKIKHRLQGVDHKICWLRWSSSDGRLWRWTESVGGGLRGKGEGERRVSLDGQETTPRGMGLWFIYGGEESRGAQERAKADDGHQHINSVGVHRADRGEEEEKRAVISVARGGGEAWGGETPKHRAVAMPRRATHAREHGTCSQTKEGKRGPREALFG
jgi:hypothetical protein